MKISVKEIEKVLDKLQTIPRDYRKERFLKLDSKRQVKVDDTLDGFTYLFSYILELIDSNVATFFTKYDGDFSVNLKPIEREKLINDIDEIIQKLSDIGATPDKDLQRQVKALSTKKRIKVIDALVLFNSLEIESLFRDIENTYTRHNGDLINDYYYDTIYEVFMAAGYGDKNLQPIDSKTITDRLSDTWRPTGENFTDMLWRYKRTLMTEVNNSFEQAFKFSLGYDALQEDLFKNFNKHLRNLKMQLRTDSTYFSTRGQEEAFTYLDIEEAVFTAVMDDRTSDMCIAADGTIIPVDDIKPGVNSPPLHENCRSTLIPLVQKLDYLTGDVYVFEDESQDTWYDQFL